MDLLSLRSVGAVGVGICEDEDGDTLWPRIEPRVFIAVRPMSYLIITKSGNPHRKLTSSELVKFYANPDSGWKLYEMSVS